MSEHLSVHKLLEELGTHRNLYKIYNITHVINYKLTANSSISKKTVLKYIRIS